MDLTYKILGGDGNQYGPVTLPQLRAWIGEGRVAPQTQLLRSDKSAWLPASDFSELQFPVVAAPAANAAAAPVGGGAAMAGAAATPATAATPVVGVAPELAQIEARIKSGASWFYWIAALSLINSVAALFGSGMGFIIGLGITQVFDGIAHSLGPTGKAVALVLDVVVLGVFVLFGVFAHKKQSWSFIVGMVLYGLDGLLFVLLGQWLAFGFHVFALLGIWTGFSALQKYQQLARPQAV